MRIVIIGDIQYEEGENIGIIAEDIQALRPDRVILLGDYGAWNDYGSCKAFQEIKDAFRCIAGEALLPLLGNHDVQYEAGRGRYLKGTVAKNYQRAFGFPPLNQILEFGHCRIICLHTDVQPADTFCCMQECYISDLHFEQLCIELEKHPDTPTIIVTHAPPAGTGLINVPEIHIRASNAYLDQDHDYMRWYDLIYRCRQVIMWFSGHYHIGHWHSKSRVERAGLTFYTTGSPTTASRDGQRHSRVLDIEGDRLYVSTYDHGIHMLCEKKEAYKLAVRREASGQEENVFSTGCGAVTVGGLKLGRNGKVYAQTDNGYLWEIDLKTRTALGTLHYSKKYKLDDFMIGKNHVWRICGSKALGHRYDDPNRFMREYDYEDCRFVTCDADSIQYKKSAVPNVLSKYGGRPWCRINENTVLTSFNDENGRLFFEIHHE